MGGASVGVDIGWGLQFFICTAYIFHHFFHYTFKLNPLTPPACLHPWFDRLMWLVDILSPDQEELEFMLQQNRTLGVSKLRFLPKSTKVRPIVNLGSKVQLPCSVSRASCRGWGKKAESVNRQLQDVFHVLKYEKVCLKIWHHGTIIRL